MILALAIRTGWPPESVERLTVGEVEWIHKQLRKRR